MLQRQRLARQRQQSRATCAPAWWTGEACPARGQPGASLSPFRATARRLGEHDDQEQVRRAVLERLRQTLVDRCDGHSSQRERLNQSRQWSSRELDQVNWPRSIGNWTNGMLPEELGTPAAVRS
ncbi:hypothetical protein ACPA9J_27955 [Pseudomonas aeruginosa]